MESRTNRSTTSTYAKKRTRKTLKPALYIVLALMLALNAFGLSTWADEDSSAPISQEQQAGTDQADPDQAAVEPPADEGDAANEPQDNLDNQDKPDEPQLTPPEEESAPPEEEEEVAQPPKKSGDKVSVQDEETNNPLMIQLTTPTSDPLVKESGLPIQLQATVAGSGLPQGGGVVAVFPWYQLVETTINGNIGSGLTEVVDNFDLNGDGTPDFDKATLVWLPASGTGGVSPSFMVNYSFKNGLTPDGATQAVNAYVLEATGVPIGGSGTVVYASAGGGYADTAGYGGATVSTKTITGKSNESWTVEQATSSPTFSNLIERNWSDVEYPAPAENLYNVSYNLSVKSQDLILHTPDTGRVLIDSLTVNDKLEGYLASGKPTKIEVKTTQGAIIASTEPHGSADDTWAIIGPLGDTSTEFNFNVPGVTGNVFYPGDTFTVNVTYNKNDYTQLLGTSTPAAPINVTNTTKVIANPAIVTDQTVSQAQPDVKTISLGWKQKEPSLPSLTIRKFLERGGLTGTNAYYNSALAASYGDTLNGDNESSKISYTLTPYNVSTLPWGPTGGAQITVPLIVSGTDAFATFPVIQPGDYLLTETGTGIAGFSEITGLTSSSAPVYVHVSEIDPGTNASTLKLYGGIPTSERPYGYGDPGTASTGIGGTVFTDSQVLQSINHSDTISRLAFTVKKQQPYQDQQYWTFDTTPSGQPALGPATINLVSGSAIIATKTSVNGVVTFENVPVGPYYTITAAGTPCIDNNDYIFRSVAQGEATSAPVLSSPITSSTSATNNTYTVFLDSNRGGFRSAKLFVRPDGTTAVTETTYTASFQLYEPAGTDAPGEGLTPVSGGAFTIKNTDSYVSGLTTIQKDFASGTYYIREVSLTGSTNIAGKYSSYTIDDYPLIQADDIKVTVTAGSYLATPTGPAPAAGLGHLGVKDGKFVNISSDGEIAIESFNQNGTAKAGTYQIKTTGGAILYTITTSATGNSTIAVNTGPALPAGAFVGTPGKAKLLIAPGTYTVTTTSVANQVILASSGSDHVQGTGATVTVVVGSGSLAATESAVSFSTSSGITTITPNASANTATFVQAFLPKLTVNKVRSDNGASKIITATATMFTLYKLNGDGTAYEKVTKSATVSSNVATFADVPAGKYALVETAGPANFVTPGYLSAFAADPAWPTAAAISTVESSNVKIVEVGYDKYHVTTVQTVAAGEVTNVPKTTLTVRSQDSVISTAANLPTSTFDLYLKTGEGENDYTKIGTSTNANANATGTTFTANANVPASMGVSGGAILLAPGSFEIRQTSTKSDHVTTNQTLRFTVGENGITSAASWWNPDNDGVDVAFTSPVSNSNFTVTTGTTVGANGVAVVFGNAIKPSIRFVKLGETNEFKNDGTSRVAAELPGAVFNVYWTTAKDGNKPQGEKHYLQVAANGVVTEGGTSADIVTSAAVTGAVNLSQLNPVPGRYYWLEEISAPEILGGNADGMEYKLEDPKEIAFSFNGSVYNITNPHDPKGTAPNQYYELLNKIAPQKIKVSKISLSMKDPTNWLTGFTSTVTEIVGAKFTIYKYIDWDTYIGPETGGEAPNPSAAQAAYPDHKGPKVDEITIGTGDIEASNSGYSRDLPPGKYIVAETGTPMFYSALDTWQTPELKGNQDSSVYVNTGNINSYWNTLTDLNKPENQTKWEPTTTGSGIGTENSPIPHSWVVDLTEYDPDHDTTDVFFGNSNNAFGGGTTLHRLIRVYGLKSGYTVTTDGDLSPNGPIVGVNFDIYPAYKDDAGVYHKLPTVGDTSVSPAAIATVKSGSVWDGGTQLFGQFLTPYFDITAAFYNSATAAADHDAWLAREDVAEWTSNGAIAADKPAGEPLTSGTDIIDWAKVEELYGAEVAASLHNKMDNWGVVFVEKGPLPPQYNDINEAISLGNYPTFGLTVTNTGGLFATFNGRGVVAKNDNPELDNSEPWNIPNIRGAGYLQINKNDGNVDHKITGAAFDLYRTDPEHRNLTPDASGKVAADYAIYVGSYVTGTEGTLDGTVTTPKLQPGRYYLKETSVPADLNKYGSYKVKIPNVAETAATNFASDGWIGPVTITDTVGAGTNDASIVTISDKIKPTLELDNYWNGASYSGSAYTATYLISKDGGEPVSKTVNSNNIGEFASLADGTYTLTLNTAAHTGPNDYDPNPELLDVTADQSGTNKLTFTVSNSAIVPADATNGLKLNGSPVAGTQFLAGDTAIWIDDTDNDGTYTLHVSHPSKGALVINKGTVTSLGITTAAIEELPDSATFAVDKFDGGSWVSKPSITWTSASAISGGIRTILDTDGLYRITEQSVSPANLFSVDSAPVYIHINTNGLVYLENIANHSSSQSSPLETTKGATPKLFYNTSSKGTLEIRKLSDATTISGINIGTDAEFDLFAADDTSHSSVIAHITHSAANGTLPAGYYATVPAGNYVVKETKAPTGFGERPEYFPVTVLAATGPHYVGYGLNGYSNALNINSLAILDPPIFNLKVVKETEYSAIGSTIPARTSKVGLMPFELWTGTDGSGSSAAANFVKLDEEHTEPQSGNPNYGDAIFNVTHEGEYRVTEYLTGSHAYLSTNNLYIKTGGNLGSEDVGTARPAAQLGSTVDNAGGSVYIKYDAATNRFVVDTERTTNTDWNKTGSGNPDKLTVQNPFIGYSFVAQKIDYASGNAIPGATFTLYDTFAHAEAGTTIGAIQTITVAAGKTYAQFDPGYQESSAGGLTRYIREDAPPSGYSLDSWFSPRIIEVSGAHSDASLDSPLATFINSQPVYPTLGISKVIKSDAPGSVVADHENPVTTPLSTVGAGGLSTTYTITPQVVDNNNQARLFNYTVSDAGIKFYGVDPVSHNSVEVTGPVYNITSVDVYPSKSYKTAAAAKAGGSKSTDLWAQVNGGTWLQLNAANPVTFGLNGNTKSIKVIYSDFDPTDEDSVALYGSVPYVGAQFEPGRIEVDVTYDQYKQPVSGSFPDPYSARALTPEVNQARNTATVSADALAVGGTVIQPIASKTSNAVLDLPVAPRPVMTITKSRDYDNLAGDGYRQLQAGAGDPEEDAQHPYTDTASYTVTLTNNSTTGAAIRKPVIIDYMQTDTMNIALINDDPTTPDATTYYKGDPESATVTVLRPNVYMWTFEDVNLAPGETVSLKVKGKLLPLVSADTVANEAFGTSAVAADAYSSDYPTGALFVASNMADVNAVYKDTPDTRYHGYALNTVREGYYNRLIAAKPDANLANLGLFVRAETLTSVIVNSANLNFSKSVSINGGDFVTSATPLQVKLGDTLTYRLQIQNDTNDLNPSSSSGGQIMTSIRIIDSLPHLYDSLYLAGSGDPERGTEWNDALRGIMKVQSGVSVTTKVAGSTEITGTDWTIHSDNDYEASENANIGKWLASDKTGGSSTLADDTASFVVSLGKNVPGSATPANETGNYMLMPHDTLTVTYSIKLDASGLADAAIADILEQNTLKVASNTFVTAYQTALALNYNLPASDTLAESNISKVILDVDSVNISGFAWDDKNYNGTYDEATENKLVNVPVTLYKKYPNPHFGVDGDTDEYIIRKVDTTDVIGFPENTYTNAEGNYSFSGLQSSYGSDIQYLVHFDTPATNYAFTTKTTAPTVSTANDSDAYDVLPSPNTNNYNIGDTGWFDANGNETHVDAGMYQESQISGIAWLDTKLTAEQFEGMTYPAPGVLVTLYRSSDSTDANYVSTGKTATTSTADGSYLFEHLRGGYYKVVFDKTALDATPGTEYQWTTSNAISVNDSKDSDAVYDSTPLDSTAHANPIILSSSTSVSTHNDAGIIPITRSISGLVWEDKDYNGIQGGAEDAGKEDVTVNLWQTTDGTNYTKIATTTTSAVGAYQFDGENSDSPTDGLAFGGSIAYRVEFVKPAGSWLYSPYHATEAANDSDAITEHTSPDWYGYSSPITDRASAIDAGIWQGASLSGRVFKDTNDDGVQGSSSDEPGITGLPVALYKHNGTAYVAVTGATTTTGTDGAYSFTGLEAGNYQVQIDRSANYHLTDTEMYLWSITGAGTPQTDSNVVGLPGARTDTTGAINPVNLVYAGSEEDLDGGIAPQLFHISGKVWQDTNYDGIQGTLASEPAISGATVQLWKNGSNTGRTALTDSNGQYWFYGDTDVSPAITTPTAGLNFGGGSSSASSDLYTVRFVSPQGHEITLYQQGSDKTKDSDASDQEGTNPVKGETSAITKLLITEDSNFSKAQNIDAGYYKLGSISGRVWIDRSGDGLQGNYGSLNTPEPGAEGAVVKLYRWNESASSYDILVDTFTTTLVGDGEYSFDGLKSGDYKLVFNRAGVVYASGDLVWTAPKQSGSPSVDSDAQFGADNTVNEAYVRTVGTAKDTGFELGYDENPAYDAGLAPDVYHVYGRVWEDKNYNGIQDSGDEETSGIAGVEVQLWKSVNGGTSFGSAPYRTVTTQAGGVYSIYEDTTAGNPGGEEGLVKGSNISYKLVFGNTDGTKTYVRTLANVGNDASDSDAANDAAPSPGETAEFTNLSAQLDAGLYQLSSITGKFLRDANGDGEQNDALNILKDNGGTGTPIGLTVTLSGIAVDGTTYNTPATFNAATGEYSFTGLKHTESGYTITFAKPGATSTESYIWTQANKSGVAEDINFNASAIDPANPTATIATVLTYASDFTNLDAGVIPQLNHISGYVWEDTDYDGLFDNGEDGINGVTVELLKSTDGGATFASFSVPRLYTTINDGDSDGHYEFYGDAGANPTAGLETGALIQYKVQFSKPTYPVVNWIFTTKNVGGVSPAIDSDANSAGLTDAITLISGGNEDIYAGLIRTSTISGRVWIDRSGDGLQGNYGSLNTPEPGAEVVVVKLYKWNVASAKYDILERTATTHTITNGNYTFEGLQSGNYKLEFDRSDIVYNSGNLVWADPQAGGGVNPATDSDVTFGGDNAAGSAYVKTVGTTIDTGFVLGYADSKVYDAGLTTESYHVYGRVWEDENYNGIQDTEESDTGIAGVEVKLWKSDNGGASFGSAPYKTVTTTAGGLYNIYEDTAAGNPGGEEGLEVGSSILYKLVFGNTDGTTTYIRTLTDVGGDNADSDAADDAANAPGETATFAALSAQFDAGLYQLSSITGKFLRDANGDGEQNDALNILKDNGGTGTPRELTVTLSGIAVDGTVYNTPATFTAATGVYTFTGLKHSNEDGYTITFAKPGATSTESYVWTEADKVTNPVTNNFNASAASPAAATAKIEVVTSYASHKANLDAGVKPLLNHISGYVWEDTDYDGLFNNGELGINGVQVELLRSTDGGATFASFPAPRLYTTINDGVKNGHYEFYGDAGLGPAVGLETGADILYKVQFQKPTLPGTWLFTSQNAGGNAAIDSDANSAGLTDAITLISGGNEDIYAGLYRASTITGKVWYDYPDTGIQGESNDPVEGIRVTLTGTASDGTNVNKVTTTSAIGTYSFTNLKAAGAANYTVTFDRTDVTADQSSARDLKWSKVLQGQDATIDSDAATPTDSDANRKASLQAAAITPLAYNGSVTAIDAGIVPYIHIHGLAWLDTNRNGYLDGSEGAIPDTGVTVELFRTIGNDPAELAAETVTDNDGIYRFDDVLIEPGVQYHVVFTNPEVSTYNFTVAGNHETNPNHTATNLTSAPGATNPFYFITGATSPLELAAHSVNDLNAGLYTIPSYQVTYKPNNGSSSWTITVKAGDKVPQDGTNVSNLGYTLNGWFVGPANTQQWNFATGLMPESDLTLNAVWTPIPYTVTYDGNGNTGGTAPTDSNIYKIGDKVTVKGKANLVKTGYTFLGWSLDKKSGAVTYKAKDSFTMPNSNVTLYAVWQKNPAPPADKTYTVTYSGNGNTGGSAPSDSTKYKSGSTVTVKGQSNLARNGYTFLGWSTNRSANVATYSAGNKFTIRGNVTLYAVWRANTPPPVVPPVVVPPIVDPPEVTEPTPAAIDDDPQPPVTPPVTPPGRTTDPTTTPQPDPQPTPTPEPEPTTQELLDSQTGNPLTDIFGGLVPFATGIGAWSLLSLLLSVLAIIITILLFVGLFRRRKNKYEDDKEIEVYGENTEDEKEKRRKANICRLLTMIAGILTPIIWLILDNLNQPMAWINKWTPYVAFIFIVHIVLLIVFKYRSRNRDRDDDIEYVEVDQNTAG